MELLPHFRSRLLWRQAVTSIMTVRAPSSRKALHPLSRVDFVPARTLEGRCLPVVRNGEYVLGFV